MQYGKKTALNVANLCIRTLRTFLMLKINFLMTSFGYIVPCPFTLLHLLPTVLLGIAGYTKAAVS